MIHKINEIRKKTVDKNPLIHCITNPISINQCANGVLAVGARPMMAEHPMEVSEITQTADARDAVFRHRTAERQKYPHRLRRKTTFPLS